MSSYPSTYKEWLAKLISFDTICTKSNLALANYLKGYLESVGLKPVMVYNDDKTKANVWTTLPGADGATQGGIVLSGHMDVVAVEGQKWDSDPFRMVEKDGKLYGRGTCDMKGFLAIVLALTPTFLSMKRVKPIHYAFSFDEELGCIGVPFLVKYLKSKGFKADCCFVGDGDMSVGTGNKGHCVWRVTVHGKAIHSSMALMNTSCNAIEYAAMIIAKVRQMALEIREKGARDCSYACPFSPVSTNLLKGGNAVNTVPAECEFEFNVRTSDPTVASRIDKEIRAYIEQTILPAMRVEYPEAKVDIVAYNSCSPFNADETAPFTRLVRKMMNDTKVKKSTGTTEAGAFQEDLGIPTVIAGPGGKGAHEANEYTTIENMERCMKLTKDLVMICAGSEKPIEAHL